MTKLFHFILSLELYIEIYTQLEIYRKLTVKITIELRIDMYFNVAFHCNLTVKFISNLFTRNSQLINGKILTV